MMQIDCSLLYKAMGGYESDGGRYNAAQRVLKNNGWRYIIQMDAWIAPTVARLAVAPKNEDRSLVERRVRDVLDAQGDDIVGFAIVVWSRDGTSVCDAATKDGQTIPTILIPDFVRSRLLAQRIETWTIEALEGQ